MPDFGIPDNALVRAGIVAGVVYLGAFWLALIAWTWQDSAQRIRGVFWRAMATLFAVCFFLPGFWLYLMVRPKTTLSQRYSRTLEEELLLQELQIVRACPNCRARVEDNYLMCPVCCADLKEACTGCGRALSFAWAACPLCRTRKPPSRARAGTTDPLPAPAAPSAAGSAPRPVRAPALRPQKDVQGVFLRPEEVDYVASVIRELREKGNGGRVAQPGEPAAVAPARTSTH